MVLGVPPLNTQLVPVSVDLNNVKDDSDIEFNSDSS